MPVALITGESQTPRNCSSIGVLLLVKEWGSLRAVNALSFDVPAGQIFVLLRPKGVGKMFHTLAA